MTRSGVLIGGVFTLAGCGCPSLATLNVQDPEGVSTPEEIDIVSRAADEFAQWTGRESVCVDTIELTNVADSTNDDAVGAYFGPGEPIRIEVGTESWLPGVVWHELGHALDDVEQIALSQGWAFPTEGIDEHYEGAETRIDEAFAQAAERGPPPRAMLDAFEDGCDNVSAQDQVLRELVFPNYAEEDTIGFDPSAHWERIATLNAAIYDVQPFTDADGTSGLVGVSYVAEGSGYRYTFHRMRIGWTDAGLPSIVEEGTLDVVFATGAGDARFIRNLDGQVVVLISQDLDDRWLSVPDLVAGTWSELDLPGIVAVLDDQGVASFENGNVWWEDYGDGFGLQGSTLSGEPLPVGQFDDGEAKPPYAISAAGGVYSMVRDPQFEEYDVQRWDGAWSEPGGPRGFYPQGAATAGDEIALARRVGARGAATAVLYKPEGGEWSLASETCGQEISPLLIGGEWYGFPLDSTGTGLYHWVP